VEDGGANLQGRRCPEMAAEKIFLDFVTPRKLQIAYEIMEENTKECKKKL
jgi:hypothetical protein